MVLEVDNEYQIAFSGNIVLVSTIYYRNFHVVFMPTPFEEWWKEHIVLPLSVRPRPMTLAICV